LSPKVLETQPKNENFSQGVTEAIEESKDSPM
jgi:hypothetical protein